MMKTIYQGILGMISVTCGYVASLSAAEQWGRVVSVWVGVSVGLATLFTILRKWKYGVPVTAEDLEPSVLGTVLDAHEPMWDFHTKMFYEMPASLRKIAVDWLRENLPAAVKEQIAVEINKDRDNWLAPHHFGWGMAIRNELRTHAGKDDSLPSGNWDDYYGACVEASVGARNGVCDACRTVGPIGGSDNALSVCVDCLAEQAEPKPEPNKE